MLHVEFVNDMLSLKADTPTGTGKPRLIIAFPPEGAWYHGFHFVTTHENIEAGTGVELVYPERLEDPTTGNAYKLVPQEVQT